MCWLLVVVIRCSVLLVRCWRCLTFAVALCCVLCVICCVFSWFVVPCLRFVVRCV